MKILFVLRNLKVGGGTTFLLRAAMGVVDEANLDGAIACNFGDGFPGLQPEVTAEWLISGFERVLTHFSMPEGRAELNRIQARLEQNHSLDAVAARLETIYHKARSAKAGIKS